MTRQKLIDLERFAMNRQMGGELLLPSSLAVVNAHRAAPVTPAAA